MRSDTKVAALSLSVLLGACGTTDRPAAARPDDVTPAPATATAPELVTAPQAYERMRFVSDIEQSRATQRAMKPGVAHQHHTASSVASVTSSEVATEAVATLASAPTPVLTAEAPRSEPSVLVSARPAPEPQRSHGGPSADGDVLDHAGSGGGLGGLLGGNGGTVVIRGGRAGMGKCDPRTDARNRSSGKPDFIMPSPVGRDIFGGANRR